MQIFERLEQLLDEKDEQIERLEGEIENLQAEKEWKWTQYEKIENDSLPSPRLELRWSNIGEWERTCTYSLVYKHLLGFSVKIPLGETKVSGRMADTRLPDEWKPFRDGAHFRNEMAQLELPGYIVIGDEVVHKIDQDD